MNLYMLPEGTMTLFLQVLGMVFIAEMGDKTQFLMIAMASKYRIRDILPGVGAAICVLNILAISVGTLLGGVLPTTAINLVAGMAFLYFAFASVCGGGDGEHSVGKKGGCPVFTVFGTFFLAELGDKTQLTALAMAAASSSGGVSPEKILSIFLGASAALFAADLLGLVVGYFLGKTLPSSVFAWISFAIFAVFGCVRLLSGFEELFEKLPSGKLYSIFATAVLCIIFAAVCIFRIIYNRKRKNESNAENE